jgi:hypothetical protein
MSFNITYKILCEVALLHSYFLNNGIEEYNNMTTEKKTKMLKNYNFKNFIEIVPSIETAKIIKNNHLVFNANNSSFKIGVKISPDDADLTFSNIPLGLTLNFIIRIKDSFFENYTSITPSSQLFYISNTKPSDEPVSFKYIPLNTATVFIDDSYKISQLSSTKILDTLEANEKNDIFGIISLKMQGDSTNLNILSPLQKIITPTPSFKIHFNNRKTFWKYIRTSSGFEVETTLEKPLTQNGFVEISPTDFTTNPPEVNDFKYPNPSVNSIKKIATKTYSQIFI